MLSPPMIRNWARRLINSELDTESSSTQPELPSVRVYEKLRRQLCAPVGIDGFQALAFRALSLAKSRDPNLSTVQLTANGGLRGLEEIEFPSGTDAGEKVGIVLIAELLGLVLTLLGEAATVRLIEGIPLQNEAKVTASTNAMSQLSAGTSYLGPFEGIGLEADHLRNVSERLEILMDKHSDLEELGSVAGSIRGIAAVLDVFTLIRSKAGTSDNGVPDPPIRGYIN